MDERVFQFECDKAKADANARKHGVTFELASTIFFDQTCSRLPAWSTVEVRSAGFPSGSPATAGLHHIPPGARVLMPVSIEKGVWEYFSSKAEQRGISLSELVTEVLSRDIEVNEALK